MSSIDERILEKSKSVSKKYTHESWRNLPQKIKDELTKIDPDGKLYQNIGEKCFFCKHIITKSDVSPPNEVYDAMMEGEKVTAHGKCLEYVLKKYPNNPMTELEGKIVRVRVG